MWGRGIVQFLDKYKECIDVINYRFYFDEEDIIYYKDFFYFFMYVDDRKLKNLKNEILLSVRYGNYLNINNFLFEFEEILKKLKVDK